MDETSKAITLGELTRQVFNQLSRVSVLVHNLQRKKLVAQSQDLNSGLLIPKSEQPTIDVKGRPGVETT